MGRIVAVPSWPTEACEPLWRLSGGVDEVAQDGAGGGPPPGAPAVEHEVAHRGALHEDGVEALPHGGQRVLDGHHRRVHPHADLAGVGLLGDGEELDDVAHAPGEGDVDLGDAGDALVVDVAGGDGGAERDAGDDGGLGAGVVALDVGGGVGLGEAERLRLGERVGVRRARLGHAGEDVVGGAVDDAHHPGDALPHERLAERPDDRDAAGHGRLEQQVDARSLGRLEQLGARARRAAPCCR